MSAARVVAGFAGFAAGFGVIVGCVIGQFRFYTQEGVPLPLFSTATDIGLAALALVVVASVLWAPARLCLAARTDPGASDFCGWGFGAAIGGGVLLAAVAPAPFSLAIVVPGVAGGIGGVAAFGAERAVARLERRFSAGAPRARSEAAPVALPTPPDA